MLCSILDDAIYKSNIFPNEPPFHKACLIIIYQFWENGFYTVCYSFCCNFVICIKKSYRAPIFYVKWFYALFWNKFNDTPSFSNRQAAGFVSKTEGGE